MKAKICVEIDAKSWNVNQKHYLIQKFTDKSN